MTAFGVEADIGALPDSPYTTRMTKIASAGNSDSAAYAVLLSKGYTVKIEKKTDCNAGWYVAEKDGSKFIGDTPIETLGLIAMFEYRGEDWKPTDLEVMAITEFEEAAFGGSE